MIFLLMVPSIADPDEYKYDRLSRRQTILLRGLNLLQRKETCGYEIQRFHSIPYVWRPHHQPSPLNGNGETNYMSIFYSVQCLTMAHPIKNPLRISPPPCPKNRWLVDILPSPLFISTIWASELCWFTIPSNGKFGLITPPTRLINCVGIINPNLTLMILITTIKPISSRKICYRLS